MSEPVASRPTPDWLGSDELLPWSWAVERLEAERNFWLVSVRHDGFPQARPVWGAWSDDELFLSIGHGGLQRAAAGPAAPITVHVDSAVDVVIVEGVIDRIVPYGSGERRSEPTYEVDASAFQAAAERYSATYDSYDGTELLNFLVRPRTVYGWRDEDVKTATRWRFSFTPGSARGGVSR